ncbi:hypothetical protein RAB80_017941 [Fusarium oxysporum f. sp. vasinfectum]|nr:hypothetical protein RAB80_017941 [Fusarium oxysporum f. sp. vasinfectum]
MVSTISNAEQQDLLHSSILPGHQAALRDERAPSASGKSTDNAIWISDDDSSDTEYEDSLEGHDLKDSQSDCTTSVTTSVIDHLDSMCTKHSEIGSDSAARMVDTAISSPAQLEEAQISSHESQMDLSTDPESNQRALDLTTCTPTGDTVACADIKFGISSVSPEIQSCLGASDGRLVTKATVATSELNVMTDGLSNRESGHQSQNAPETPSEVTYSSIAANPEVMAQKPLPDSKVCTSTERDNATSVARSSSPGPRLLPESRPDQDQGHGSCSPKDIEPDLLGAESGSLHAVRMSPPFREGISRRRCRQTSPHTHMTIQDKDSDADTESSDGEDRLDVKECIHVEEYRPSLTDASGDDSEDDFKELQCRKRRRVTRSQQLSTRRTAQLPKGRRISVRESESPAPSQTSSVPSDAGIFARFEEWPLRNVSLKRITEEDKTTFQLQFDWTPDPSQPHADRSVSHSKQCRGAPRLRFPQPDRPVENGHGKRITKYAS